MAGMMQTVATINSAVRTLLALGVVSLLGIGGWYGYSQYNAADLELREKEREIEERNKRITALEGDLEAARKRVEKLEFAVRMLKVEHRLAWVDVLDKLQGADGRTYTDVEFVEINDQREPISTPQRFRLVGDDMYVTGWIVKFKDQFVETADPDRGSSLFVFKRIFGDEQKPIDGFPLDTPGKRPPGYGGARHVPEFEQEIWDHFWELAHDEGKQEALGVRNSHGTALFIENARKGWRYEISIRASGDPSLESKGEIPTAAGPTL